MKRIRINNDFTFAWAIERNGLPEDLSTAINMVLQARNSAGTLQTITDYDVAGNIVSVEVTPEIANVLGRYVFILTYELPDAGLSDLERLCEIDTDAFILVPRTAEADDAEDLLVTSDMAIGFKGDKGDPFLYSDFTPEQLEALKVKGDPFLYTDFTPEQIVELQRPATDAATAVNEAEALRVTAETTRVENEQGRVTAEGTRQSNEIARGNSEDDRDRAEALRLSAEITRGQNEQDRINAEELRVTAEGTRQTNTAIAITNANTATGLANDAATNANAKAGLADTAANNANAKAGLADAAATNANTKAGLADAAATNANNVANTYAAELASKELKANKQNSLTADGTGTKFPTVDAVNAGLSTKQATLVSGTNIKTVNGVSLLGSGDVSNLIFEYIHSSNKEVIIESIDFATNTFTSTNHGLINGQFVTPILNSNAGNVYPFDVLVTGCKGKEYQIANKTDNTFQLYEGYTTNIVTLTDSATKDFTKWHFEVFSVGSGIDITNLNITRDFIIEWGVKTLGSFFVNLYLNENTLSLFKTGLGSENISFNTLHHIDLAGGVVHYGFMRSNISINSGLTYVNHKYMLNKTGTTTGKVSILANEQNAISTLNLINYPITRIRTIHMAMANGFTIKIYYKC